MGTHETGVASDAALESEEYRLGFEASPVGLLMVNERGAITRVNHQLLALFGYERDELVGQSIEVLVPKRVRKEHASARDHYLRAPSRRSMGTGHLTGVRKDGSEVAVEIGLNPLPIVGGMRVLATVHDVTQQRAQESELRSRVEELQRHRRLMDMLNEMSSLLQHATNEDEVHHLVESFSSVLLDTDAAVYTHAPDGKQCGLAWSRGEMEFVSSFRKTDCWAVRRNLPHMTGDAKAPRCHHLAEWTARTACLPIGAHGSSIGLLVLRYSDGDVASEESTLRIGRSIADHLGLALSGLRFRSRVQHGGQG